MVERIGIRGFLPFNIEEQLQSLKRNLLFFDRICVRDLENQLAFLMSRPQWIEDSEFLAGEIEWLRDQNLIFEIKDNDLPIPTIDKAKDVIELLSLSNRIHQESSDTLKELIEIVKKSPDAENLKKLNHTREKVQKISKSGTEFYSRAIAIGLNNSPKIMATPIIETMAKLPEGLKSKEVDIINIVLDKIPCPISATPWEQILDFKNDPDSKAKLIGLRQWTSDISKENLSIKEASEKIQWLLSEYSKHMDLHKMKTQVGVVKFILVSCAGLIENLVKLQLGEFTKKILSTESVKVRLLESELSAPNRELGYLHLVHEKFGAKNNQK